MANIDKYASSRWGLPVEQALRVEVLRHNMELFGVKTEQSLRKLLSGILENKESVDRIMRMSPFNLIKDRRFQIFITYRFYRPKYIIEYEGLEGNENTVFEEPVYWNWYSTEKEALEKYEQKLSLLRDDPYSYADPGCMDVKLARIQLIDTADDSLLKEKYFSI